MENCTKKINSWFFHKPLTAVTGHHSPPAPRRPPTWRVAPLFLPLAGPQERAAQGLHQKRTLTHPNTDLSRHGPEKKLVQSGIQVSAPVPLQKWRSGAGSSNHACACWEPAGNPRGSQTGSEPGTQAATNWQWCEFYYYPIITLGSVPKWSMLPPLVPFPLILTGD